MAIHALLCRWKAKMSRTFFPFAVITSQWSVGAHTLSQNQRQTYAPHTAERTKPLRWEVSSESLPFTMLSPGGALTPVTVWSGCSHHTTLQFSGSRRSLGIFKMCEATAKPFSCFSTFFCKQESKLMPCCSCFKHTPVSSVPQFVTLCATFSAPLDRPFYSLVAQVCQSSCTYLICRYPSTFFFHRVLQHDCKLASSLSLPNQAPVI